MATKKLKLPEPKQYFLTYEQKNYVISLPISVNKKTVTAYCFGRGVRSFSLSKITELRELGDSLVSEESEDEEAVNESAISDDPLDDLK